MKDIELSDMLVTLRKELMDAQKKGAAQDLKFKVEDVELEVQFTTTNDLDGKVGVKFWVYNAEAGGKTSDQTVHRLRLKLIPQLSGGDLKISDTDRKPK